MAIEKIEDNASLEDIEKAYKILRDCFNSSMEEFSRNFDILKYSKANEKLEDFDLETEGEKDEILQITKEMTKLKGNFDKLESYMENIKSSQGSTDYQKKLNCRVEVLNLIIDNLEKIDVRANKLKQNLPIVQAIKFFVRNVGVAVGKFCEAIVNFFKRTAPVEQAEKARTSMLTHFNRLSDAVEEHKKSVNERKDFRLRT